MKAGGPKPTTKQRSPWKIEGRIADERWPTDVPAPIVATRNVHDGRLLVMMADEPTGIHLSISHPRRYPTWDEITHARYALLPNELTFAMLLPPQEEYVAVHDFCFHLHQVEL